MLTSLPPIAEAAHSMRSGDLLPIDLVEFCLCRIQESEDRTRAWVFVDEEGARQTAERQSNLFKQGVDPGPLAGIPVGIKDIIDVAGWPTKAGSPLREQHISAQDAELVSRLRAAGAIILGKTVTTEFACFDPPPTRNPWDLNRTPGGSSSGSAASVAVGMCMVAIGTQTGGSIIRPSSYCGVVGLKPTFGQVPLEGVVPVSHHLDHAGPIAKCVHDAAIVYEHIREPDSPLEPDNCGVSLCVIKEFFLEGASPQVQSATQAGIDFVLGQSRDISTLTLPESFTTVHDSHKLIMAVDAAAFHRQGFASHPDNYGPNISSLLKIGLSASAVDYVSARQHQRRFQTDVERMFPPGCIAIMAATNTTAPGLATTGDPSFQSPWSFAGAPSITIPGGLAADGLPWGLQLVGPRNSELRLLRAAQWCEERLGFAASPALLN